MPIRKNQKFAASLIESIVLVGFSFVVVVILGTIQGIDVGSSDLFIFTLIYSLVYNLCAALPPARALTSGWKILLVIVEISSLVLILLVESLVSMGLVAILCIVCFMILYTLHYVFYDSWGYGMKGVLS